MIPVHSLRAATAALLLLAFAVPAPADGPARSRAMSAYDRIQGLRDEAWKLVDGQEAPSREAIEAGIAKLEEALAHGHRPEIRELATGNAYLYARDYDVLRDLAAFRLKLGQKEEALTLLERMNQEAWLAKVAPWLAKKKDFESLRDEPRFKAVLATMEMSGRLWSTPAIAVPYAERLPLETRIAGLSVFWAEARQGFVHFDKVPGLAWDKAYLEVLPAVMAADTTQDYYRALQQFAARLGDSHTSVIPPKELHGRMFSRPPIVTARVEGRVIVTEVRSASLAERVKVGDEIVAIDGLPVARYAEERVAPAVSASTPQDRELRLYTYELLLGDGERPVELSLKRHGEVERVEKVARQGYSDLKGREHRGFRMLAGDVAYLEIDHFESNESVKRFEQALPEILKAKALVIDIRRNGGGSSDYGIDILSYLTDQPIRTAKSRVRGETSHSRTRFGPEGIVEWKPVAGDDERPETRARDRRFPGPVALLIGSATFSAAEDFALYFDVAKRGILVGSPTGGSTGQPILFPLPGGGRGRICVKRDTYPDGREFVGKGILPDIAASTTVEAVRAGRDPVLDAAVAALLTRR